MAKPNVSSPGANAHANLRGYWTKVHQIFIRRGGVICGVKVHIHVAILPLLWNARARKEGKYANFAHSCQKSVTLSDREKKNVGLITPTHMCTYPENLVKIGPVYSEITAVSKATVKKDYDERQ